MQAITDDFMVVLARVTLRARKDANNYKRLRKALKLINTWPDSPRRTIHRSKIMGYMNKLRGAYVACN